MALPQLIPSRHQPQSRRRPHDAVPVLAPTAAQENILAAALQTAQGNLVALQRLAEQTRRLAPAIPRRTREVAADALSTARPGTETDAGIARTGTGSTFRGPRSRRARHCRPLNHDRHLRRRGFLRFPRSHRRPPSRRRHTPMATLFCNRRPRVIESATRLLAAAPAERPRDSRPAAVVAMLIEVVARENRLSGAGA